MWIKFCSSHRLVNFVVMMIEKHISALLYRYQCVTVSGFGAFLTENCPARLDEATHTFYPPKKRISFNANVKNNDGLLANHIALQEKISYSEAVGSIAKAVANWQQALNNFDTVSLKNLGELNLNTEGNVVFIPNAAVNYLTGSFGLGTVASSAVLREQFKAQVEELEEKAPIHFTPERKSSYAYLKYAAVFVVMAAVGSAGIKTYHEQQVATQTLAVQKAVQEKVQQRIQQATFFIDNPLPAVSLPVKEVIVNKPYHVVAGAYRSAANAEKAVAQLKAEGFEAHKLDQNKFGLYPVLYGSYATHAEAQKNMRHIHKTHNAEAWLMVKEL